MKVRMKSTMAGPTIMVLAGSTIDLDPAHARALVAAGYAEFVDAPAPEAAVVEVAEVPPAPEAAVVEAEETAVLPAPQPRTTTARRGRKTKA